MSWKLLPILALGLGLSAGCETLGLGGDDKDDEDRDRIEKKDDERVSRGPDRDRLNYDNPEGVPVTAHMARESMGRDLSYKTPHDGTLYLYDVDDRRVAWSGSMRDGERFQLDAESHRATVDGREVMDRNLSRDHEYRIYFDIDR